MRQIAERFLSNCIGHLSVTRLQCAENIELIGRLELEIDIRIDRSRHITVDGLWYIYIYIYIYMCVCVCVCATV